MVLFRAADSRTSGPGTGLEQRVEVLEISQRGGGGGWHLLEFGNAARASVSATGVELVGHIRVPILLRCVVRLQLVAARTWSPGTAPQVSQTNAPPATNAMAHTRSRLIQPLRRILRPTTS